MIAVCAYGLGNKQELYNMEMKYITLEMVLYGATALGGCVIYIGRKKHERAELWKVVSVMMTGFMFGMAFTIPAQGFVNMVFKGIHIGESSRIAIALVLGLLAPYAFLIIDDLLTKVARDPSMIGKAFVELIKRLFNLKFTSYGLS